MRRIVVALIVIAALVALALAASSGDPFAR